MRLLPWLKPIPIAYRIASFSVMEVLEVSGLIPITLSTTIDLGLLGFDIYSY